MDKPQKEQSKYTPDLDIEVIKPVVQAVTKNPLVVEVRDYNGGGPKVQIGRKILRKGKEDAYTREIGRLTVEDATWLQGVLLSILSEL